MKVPPSPLPPSSSAASQAGACRLRGEELAALQSEGVGDEFYKRLKQVQPPPSHVRRPNSAHAALQLREYHRANPGLIAEPMKLGLVQKHEDGTVMFDGKPIVQFSGEEGFGRYLDMSALHSQYANLKGVEPLTYTEYLTQFHKLDIPRAAKNGQYRAYAGAVLEYLAEFFARAHPLHDTDAELAAVAAEFETAWASGQRPGWEEAEGGAKGGEGQDAAEPIDLADYADAAALEGAGLDRLKVCLPSARRRRGR